jgi:hypothetical protein
VRWMGTWLERRMDVSFGFIADSGAAVDVSWMRGVLAKSRAGLRVFYRGW